MHTAPDDRPDDGFQAAASPARPLLFHPFRGMVMSAARVGDPASARIFGRPYRQTPRRLADWERLGHLHHDAVPGLYIHEYSDAYGTVRGLVGALDLSTRAQTHDGRAIFAHEGILVPHARRIGHRMHQLKLNPAPILLVHEAPEQVRVTLSAYHLAPPTMDFHDRGGQHHRIWPITDPAAISSINDALSGCSAMIADGHHRYAAYLELQQQFPGTPWDRGLAMLVDHTDTPLFLGAIHRAFRGIDLADLRQAALSIGLHTLQASRDAALAVLDPEHILATNGREWLAITMLADDPRTPVEVLQRSLIPALHRHPVDTLYRHSVEETLNCLEHQDEGPVVAVLMPAPTLRAVTNQVRAGHLMPQKATSFQPKPHVGVLMRMLSDEEDEPGHLC